MPDAPSRQEIGTAADKRKALEAGLPDSGPIIISFSGGVDSSLLAAVAYKCRGEQVRCVLLDSPLIPRRAVRDAIETAKSLGITLEVIPFPIMEEFELRSNPKNRCYLCKKHSSRLIKAYAKEHGASCIIDGMNASDIGEYRPGLTAADEEGIRHPFIEAGITKQEIRGMARDAGYPFWDRPSSACLASRVPYGEDLTPGKLQMIEEAEMYMNELGFSQVRVRFHDRIARIELLPEEMERIFPFRAGVVQKFRKIGFPYVTLDLSGFRSGSMDEAP